MATEKDLKRQGLWDYERDQPLRRNRPVPDETMDRSKPELPTSKERTLLIENLSDARAYHEEEYRWEKQRIGQGGSEIAAGRARRYADAIAEAALLLSQSHVETTTGHDSRPLCANCGEQYHKHGKGDLACPGPEMGNVYRAREAPALPHASLALKEFMSELGEIMSMDDGATPADYLQRAREIRQWCSDHQGSALKTSGELIYSKKDAEALIAIALAGREHSDTLRQDTEQCRFCRGDDANDCRGRAEESVCSCICHRLAMKASPEPRK